MTADQHTADVPRRVVVVGGGVAGVETVLALHDLAGSRVSVTMIAPEEAFSLRPLTVAVPFGRGPVGAFALADLMAEHGGTFVQAAVEAVDPDRRLVTCRDGQEVPYDALVLTPGARTAPALASGITFDPQAPGAAGAVAEAVERGWARTVAFVVPEGRTWPLPLYELALLTADQTRGRYGVSYHLVTPETTPLAVFGPAASQEVADRLHAAGIVFHGGVNARLVAERELYVGVEIPLRTDKIVAIPVLEGRALAGVPADADGFVPIDDHGRVHGLVDVWAAGDGTDQPIKQGGIACQQADQIAAQIAAPATAPTGAAPLTLRTRLFTGAGDLFLRHTVGTQDSEVLPVPPGWQQAKVAGRYLAPYLATKDIGAPLAQPVSSSP